MFEGRSAAPGFSGSVQFSDPNRAGPLAGTAGHRSTQQSPGLRHDCGIECRDQHRLGPRGVAWPKASALTGRIAVVDAGTAAFLGAIAGAAIAGVPPIVAALTARGTAKAQREHEKAERDAQREHDRVTAERNERAQQIAAWRNGLSHAALTYQHWSDIYDNDRQREQAIADGQFVPNVVSDAWFQGLRPHLASCELHEAARLLCDDQRVLEISNEIDRIEREWA